MTISTAPVHSFSARGVEHLLEALDSMGVDRDAVSRDAGLDTERLRDPYNRIEAATILRLFVAGEARAADPLIGLHLADRIRFGSLGSYLVGSQNTIADALRMQERFQVLLLGANALTVEQRGDCTAVVLEAGSPPDAVRHIAEYCIASTCRLLRWLSLQAARPQAVHFRHGPAGDAGEYERVLACPVLFNTPQSAALVSSATLAAPLLSANEDLAARLEQLARAEMDARARLDFRGMVACALRGRRMDRATCRRAVIARHLGVSPRTLQRRLQAAGTSFGRVLDETRRQVALELIADAALSVGDVSSGVGYADQFAFNKAFRRWTGRSPSAYRREAAAGRPPTPP